MTDGDARRIEEAVTGVRLELAEMRGELKPTLEKINEKEDSQDETLKDHETRLRALERFRFAVPSLSVLAIIAAVVEGIYYATHLH